MKKTIITVSFLILVACTPLVKQVSTESQVNPIASKRNQYFADYCNSNWVTKVGKRPKLKASELSNLSEKQMDARIKEHIIAQSQHIDALEEALIQSGRQNEICH